MNSYRSRRACVRLLAGAAAAAAVLALAACSGSSGGGSGHSSGTSGPGGKNTNGTITIGTTAAPGTLDPSTSSSGADYAYLYDVFDRLLQRNPQTAALEPMLATSWKFVGADKLELDVSLRHGVKFQDGTPLNAQAVATYSQAYIKGGDAGNNLQYVTSVTADGPYTAVYHLSQQNAQLPSGLADRGGMIASPTAMAKEGKSFGTHPIGTGPYKFVSEIQGSTYKFARFDGYWDNANLPRVQNIQFKIFQNDTALVTAIRSGNVDVASSIFPQDVSTLKSISNLDVAVGPGLAFSVAYFNGARKPLDSPQIRLAFNLALNREAIMNAATDGLGQVWTEDQPPGTLGYVKSLDPVWKPDPARAKQLVKQAGYPNGTDMSCYVYAGEGYDITGPIIIAEEKAVGINLKLIPGNAAQVAPFFTNKAKPQCFFATGSGQGNPFYAYLGLWSQAYYNAGKTNFGVDQYYNQLYQTYTTAGESKIFYNIVKEETTNPGLATLYAAPAINVYQKNIGGWIISKLGLDHWQGLYFKS